MARLSQAPPAHEVVMTCAPQVYQALAHAAAARLASPPAHHATPTSPEHVAWLLWSLSQAVAPHAPTAPNPNLTLPAPLLATVAELVAEAPARFAPQAARLAAVYARAGLPRQLMFEQLGTATAAAAGTPRVC